MPSSTFPDITRPASPKNEAVSITFHDVNALIAVEYEANVSRHFLEVAGVLQRGNILMPPVKVHGYVHGLVARQDKWTCYFKIDVCSFRSCCLLIHINKASSFFSL